jgi:integrase
MPSLHRDPRGKSPFWYVSYRTPDGRQHFRSTKETDRTKAEVIADAIGKGLGKAKVGAFTETAARSIMADLYRDVTGKTLRFKSVRDWFQECLKRVEERRGKTTHQRYKAVVQKFLESIGKAREAAPLESLTAEEIQQFADARLAEGRAPKTIQNDLKPIGKFLKDAERKGLILRSPMGEVETPDAVSETRDPFTELELSNLLAYLSSSEDAEGNPITAAEKANRQDWKTAVNLGLFLGARLGDCTNLRWGSVNYDRHEIRFTPEKDRKKRELVIPMHSDLEAYLLSLPAQDSEKAYLCPTIGGIGAGKRAILSKQFGAILTAANIDRRAGQPKRGKGRTFFRLGFHSLRHTFNSSMANAGVSVELRAKLTGH